MFIEMHVENYSMKNFIIFIHIRCDVFLAYSWHKQIGNRNKILVRDLKERQPARSCIKWKYNAEIDHKDYGMWVLGRYMWLTLGNNRRLF
jgi:hypothetical protein